MSDRPPSPESVYDDIADEYASRIDDWAYNADYERPATLSLLPDLEGKRVLDVGCGPGKYAEELSDRGAEVLGIDASERMVSEARQRLAGRDGVAFTRHDVTDGLDFLDPSSFDAAVSALTLHYIEDWASVFSELATVLRDGSVFVFSTQHPFSAFQRYESASYFDTEFVSREWDSFDPPIEMPTYRRPLESMIGPLLRTGFALEEIVEPVPESEFAEKMPAKYEELSRKPTFLCVRSRLSGSSVTGTGPD
ncbi:class I SAM-dependent DNA methyltransferase [Halosimplex marinum]|uniref:class I SAM-dependent DNA methyltransferase n=1 Tax=Halosimplex marinum TaxID=3396620 RepID=UPI003F578BF4